MLRAIGRCTLLALSLLWLASGCTKAREPSSPPPAKPVLAHTPPENAPSLPAVTTRREDIVDTIFGVPVRDPYRWLEAGESPEVQRWVDAQNQRTRGALDRLGVVPELETRLAELLEIGSLSQPELRKRRDGGLRLFYTLREGRQNQPLLLWREDTAAAATTLLDVNALDAAGTTSLDYFQPSPNGELCAYGLSRDGSEESTLYVRDVASGQDLPDVIPRTRYASVCWHADGQGFFYTRFPTPGTVPDDELQYHRRVYEHRLGTPPAADRLIFGEGRDKTDYPSCSISPNGRWLIVNVSVGWNRNDIFLADTKRRPLEFKELTERKEQNYYAFAHDQALWIVTNEGAPRYTLYRAAPERPARSAWKLVLAEHASDVIDQLDVLGDRIIVSYSSSAVSRLERFDTDGRSLGEIALPEVGSIGGISGVPDVPQAFVSFESFVSPVSVERVDLEHGTLSTMLEVQTPLAPEAFQVVRRSARSKDGTTVPYTIVAKRGVSLTSGDNPTLLYGYGGFNVNLRPQFSRTGYAFLERGGVYVQANLRGGGEFGESWHRAGQLGNKQNVFDDFYAVAQGLFDTSLTRPERLAIYGRSNGGLLVAAAITQRPELFRAAVSAVPLTDMVRYPRFLMAQLWTPEYGSPEQKAAFEWLYAYSPYHHVDASRAYPATLLLTATSDTRVDPAHARKMTAQLQAVEDPARPILLRTERKAGHGAGKPMRKVAEEYADLYAFIMWQLGMLTAPAETR